ncbi:unnamed protein product [Ambrosiozyma monospora]|uniref:Unnamed protein product n=1 Tax=Ambrosiozyma monospora TaxID=43982 RepID=A0A9W7DNA4_AMBMO|nr:unnamed protein product [Ambrosiozyma monospora]
MGKATITLENYNSSNNNTMNKDTSIDEKLKSTGEYDAEALQATYHAKQQSRRKTQKKLTIIGFISLVSYMIYMGYVYLYRDSKLASSMALDDAASDPYHYNHHFQHIELSEIEKKPVVVPHEVIEIPIIPNLNYSKPVYSQSLLKATFGNCWGHPELVTYTVPKNITFNQVVLTLNTTVDGVQYDRLAHIYLDGVEIWRTSTIEPSGELSHSSSSKDVSLYASLFSRDSVPLLFQLDNLLTPRLNGSFEVQLTATYYNSKKETPLSFFPTDPSKDSSSVSISDIGDVIAPGSGSLKSIFNNREVADQVYPLVKQAAIDRPPLVYLPDTDFTSVLPQLNSNTTKAKLIIYISANAAEEFYYTNVLDGYEDIYKKKGHHLESHGPCRMVNVFVDGIRIASVNPNPTIFTGGLSPALWNPIVSSGAFDVRGLEVDLTTILPLLWSQDSDITIEVTNCLDDNLKTKKPSGIGSNWIASANLVSWEDENIESATGEILGYENLTLATGFVIGPFGPFMNQIVKGSYYNHINSTLNYTLTNGTELSYYSEVTHNATQFSMEIFTKWGDKQKVISAPETDINFSLTDLATNETITNVTYELDFPLTVSLETLPITGPTVDYQVNITKEFNAQVSADGLPFISLKNQENGTSNFTISPNGNSGVGTVEHNYTLIENLLDGSTAKLLWTLRELN